MLYVDFENHPMLAVSAFVTRFAQPLESSVCAQIVSLLRPGAVAPVESSDAIRAEIRDVLRRGGYKPTGRGKPASEYLLRAAGDGTLGAINVAVDACNAVSLHSGLPISVVDLARAAQPFRIAIAPQGSSYVFNGSGQIIDVSGLVCLFDREGACANAVKDSQRTKTNGETRETLSVVWASRALDDQLATATAWYRQLLAASGATTEMAEMRDA